METKIYNVIILDESGSMYSIARQAVSGLNETIQTIRHAQQEFPNQQHIVTLTTFNSARIHTLYNLAPIGEVKCLNMKHFQPEASTPLYDAIGRTLTPLRKIVGKKDKVLVTIITDGYENASIEYDLQSIGKMVEDLKRCGWVFTYIGANQDAHKVAASMSINIAMDYSTTEAETEEMFAKERSARGRWFRDIAANKEVDTEHFFD